jgi:hypothetical protein
MTNLNEPHAALDQAARQQQLLAEVIGLLVPMPYRADEVWFSREIDSGAESCMRAASS